MHYTSSHWGLREVVVDPDGTPQLQPFSGDPDPSEIGLDLNEAPLQDLRVRRPAVRKSWLEGGAGARTQARGTEPFVEVAWDRALDLVARELRRLRVDHGNEAIFAGSY
ncbi:MAG: molybdopterin-dependent oxidoreductase, partial [Methyloligellaceae bacterium]